MALDRYFPVWDKLTIDERKLLTQSAIKRSAPKDTLLHNGSTDYVRLFIVRPGQLRVFILSDEGNNVLNICGNITCSPLLFVFFGLASAIFLLPTCLTKMLAD